MLYEVITYLKEMEFKFNHAVPERERLLADYYFKELA